VHSDNLGALIDSIAEGALETRRIAGLSVAVAHGGSLVHARGYGYADLERPIRASPHTVYGIGSMTKQFTATAVMQLVEKRVVRLDDKLSKYLPGDGCFEVPVTIRHLLSHTAGIKGEADLAMLLEDNAAETCTAALILGLLNDELFDSPPGHVWSYSNFGYHLLGVLIEKVTGETYANYIQLSVLPRARLAATWCGAEHVPTERLARGYTERGGLFATVETPSATQTFSSGALYSTVVDLVQWQIALTQGRVIRSESYERMITPDALETRQALGYGYGFFVGTCGGHREISHDGTTGGFSSQLAHYPDDQLIVAVLTNSESHEAERIEKRITRSILRVPEPTSKGSSLSSRDLAAYVGTYLHKGLPIPVYLESQGLRVRTPSRRVVRLVYQSEDTFTQEDDPSISFAFAPHSGRSDGFVVSREGKTLATLRRLS
jgi:CubicO group peptidase (beta-lactamase class C family)